MSGKPLQGPGLLPKPHVIHDLRTGRITYSGIMRRDRAPVDEGQAILEGEGSSDTHFVRGGIVWLKTELKVEVEGRTIRGLPPFTLLNPIGHAPLEAKGDWTAPPEMGPRVIVTIDSPRHKPVTVELRDYRADRADAFMPTGEQLDAIFKGFAAIRDAGIALPDATRAWLDHVAAVKADIPKD